MKKVFAFLLMTDQGPEETRTLPGERMDTLFVPVRSLQKGCDTVRRLVAEQGLGEMCIRDRLPPAPVPPAFWPGKMPRFLAS